MTIVAVVNRAAGLDDRDVEFWADACNQQAREIAAAHGVLYTPVVFLAGTSDLPDDARVLTIRPEIDAPGALGYHDDVDGKIFAEVKYTGPDTSITVSHEICEELLDPTCDLWAPFDDNHEQALEASDRVEGDSYLQAATVLGETRQVPVSNYLLPSAFDQAGVHPFDRMGLLTERTAMTPGGYVIVRDLASGKVSDVFARVMAGPGASHVLAAKLSRKSGRLLRRLRG